MKIPLYHDFVAEGVSEEKATQWHNHIQQLIAHADNMEECIDKTSACGSISPAVRASHIYKEWKSL